MALPILLIILMLPAASCIACLYLHKSVAKSSQKYQSFILELKKQGKFEEWAYEHKALVFLENIYRYFKLSIILLLLIGFVTASPSTPKIVTNILEGVGYVYWPLAFACFFAISKLHKSVPELQV